MVRGAISAVALSMGVASLSLGWAADAVFPAGARDCALITPPAESGVFVTPGGILLIYPRNASVPEDFTGCRTIWVVRGTGDWPLLTRLYFQAGRLSRVQRFDGRGGTQAQISCSLPTEEKGCGGLEDNPLTALRVPTWPRICLNQPGLPVCGRDPE